MKTTTVDLIRHGEPQGGGMYRGNSIDDPLSEKGWSQMRAAVGNHAPWEQIVTSPMQRCHAFAKALAEENAAPLLIESHFREVGFGVWEGRTRTDVIKDNKEEYEAFYRDPFKNRPVGAEPLSDFISRVANAYDQLLALHQGKHILVVAHAGVIRAVITHALSRNPADMYKQKIRNASFTRISHAEGSATAVFVNRMSL